MPESVSIRSRDGLELRGRYFPGIAPRATLVVAHGLGEHSAVYEPLAGMLAAGPGLVNVLLFDLRGHGRSGGRHGYVRRYADLVDDLDAALAWAEDRVPELPRYVFGHSNGGQVALHQVRRGLHRVAGLILSNPCLRILAPVPWHKYLMGMGLRYLAPRVTLTSTVTNEGLSRDPANLEARISDPLRHSRISAPLFFGMVEGGATLIRSAETIQVPTLMVLGGSDPVVDPRVNRAFFERLGSREKTLRYYPETLHEPLNDLDREQVMGDIATWLANRLDATTPATAPPLKAG